MTILPSFFIIGAPKAGSTSLWHELRKHPDIFMPEVKEPNLFISEDPDWEWYQSLFQGVNGEGAVGEASTRYSCLDRFPESPKRIAAHIPDARIIYILRHPLRRIESSWRQHVLMKRLPLGSFNWAVKNYERLIEETRYAHVLNAYRRHFDDEQILVLFLREFSRNPKLQLEKCDKHIGVDPTERSRQISTSPQNVTSERRYKRRFVGKLQQIPVWSMAKKLVPLRLRHMIRQSLLLTRLPQPEWEPDVKRWALSQLRSDAYEVLKYSGKPIDYWELQ